MVNLFIAAFMLPSLLLAYFITGHEGFFNLYGFLTCITFFCAVIAGSAIAWYFYTKDALAVLAFTRKARAKHRPHLTMWHIVVLAVSAIALVWSAHFVIGFMVTVKMCISIFVHQVILKKESDDNAQPENL